MFTIVEREFKKTPDSATDGIRCSHVNYVPLTHFQTFNLNTAFLNALGWSTCSPGI